MKVVLLAADSLGTRSMASYVETSDCSILIDPGVCLAPNKFGLPPHPVELKALEEQWAQIVKHAKKAEVLIVSHYHYDHYNPRRPELYKGKVVLLKHPTEKINASQRARAKEFLKAIEGLPKKLDYCDGKTYKFGKTKLLFSEALPHGLSPKLGYILETFVDDGKLRLLHSSDVEGPALKEQADFILKQKPNFLILDGPLSGMLGFRYPQSALNSSIQNMLAFISSCPLKNFILEHHFLRDPKWQERAAKVLEAAKQKGIKLQTAAEFNGKRTDVLELRRKELFKQQPAKKAKLTSEELLP